MILRIQQLYPSLVYDVVNCQMTCTKEKRGLLEKVNERQVSRQQLQRPLPMLLQNTQVSEGSW